MEFGVGSIVDGKVTGITKFGAFISLPEGKSGLVHISEIAHSYVSEVSEHLSEGQEVKVKVIGIDQTNRINLSIKKATEAPPRQGGFDRPRQGGFDRPRQGGTDRPRQGNFDRSRPQNNFQRGEQGDRQGGQGRSEGGENRGNFSRGEGGYGGQRGEHSRNPRPQVYAPRPAPKEPTDFEDKLKSFMQSSDSKLAEMRHMEKKGTRRGRK